LDFPNTKYSQGQLHPPQSATVATQVLYEQKKRLISEAKHITDNNIYSDSRKTKLWRFEGAWGVGRGIRSRVREARGKRGICLSRQKNETMRRK